MKYIEYREKKEHGTKMFPIACYHVSGLHPRYNMIHHWHDEFEIILVKSGKFNLSLDGKEHTISKGECAIVAGGSLHGGIPDNCVYDCVVFDLGALLKCSQSCLAKIQPVISRQKTLRPVFGADTEYAAAAKVIVDEMLAKEEGYEFRVIGKLIMLFGEIVVNEECFTDFEPGTSETKKIKKFKNVLSYIEEHYKEPITLEDMAEQCGMNRNYFCRAFKDYTKKTPVEYLNYYRIESACEQIVGTEEKLIDIAKSCGFNDYSYFIKVFKSQKGVTPRDYCRKSF